MQAQTLDTFYKSKQWEALLKVIKLERVNSDGELVCAYCGKPITRKYDAIGHHKIELTEENVNDASISLNPDLVEIVHHRCHNYIHNKLGYKVRQVFIVYGPPRAGKTTFVRDNMTAGDLVVDIDSIWECISAQDRYIKPPRLNAVAFKMRDALLDAVKYRLGKWNAAYVVGGYPLQSERERLCKDLGAREIYIDTPRDICIQRVYDSGLPKDIQQAYEGYIDAWFDKNNISI